MPSGFCPLRAQNDLGRQYELGFVSFERAIPPVFKSIYRTSMDNTLTVLSRVDATEGQNVGSARTMHHWKSRLAALRIRAVSEHVSTAILSHAAFLGGSRETHPEIRQCGTLGLNRAKQSSAWGRVGVLPGDRRSIRLLRRTSRHPRLVTWWRPRCRELPSARRYSPIP